jgi:hypothetical protein
LFAVVQGFGGRQPYQFFGWIDVFHAILRVYSGIKTVVTKTESDSETSVGLNHVMRVPVLSYLQDIIYFVVSHCNWVTDTQCRLLHTHTHTAF